MRERKCENVLETHLRLLKFGIESASVVRESKTRAQDILKNHVTKCFTDARIMFQIYILDGWIKKKIVQRWRF